MRTVSNLKSSLSLLVAACAVAGISSQLHAANLLLNPGFEAPPSTVGTDDVIAGWTPIGAGMTRATFAAHTGSYGLWMKTFQLIGGGAMQEVEIVSGTPYTFSAFSKFEANFPTLTPNVLVEMKVDWLDSGGGTLSTDKLEFRPNTVNGADAGAWVQQSIPGLTSPASSSKARISLGWDFGETAGQIAYFFDDVIFDGQGTAPTGNIWLTETSGDWNQSANWSSGTSPNAVDTDAKFLGAITAARTIYTDTPVTVGSLAFDNANQYVIAGAGSLLVDVSAGSASIDVASGSHKINLPMTLNDNTAATIATGATLTIADPLTQVNGAVLTASGGGTLNIISTVNNTTIGGLVANNATINAEMDLTNKMNVTATAGTINLKATQHLNNVSGTTGKIVLSSGKKLIRANSVNMASTSQLDLSDGRLIIDYATVPPMTSIRTQIASGRAGGAWNGPGINSSAAAADSRLAIGAVISGVVGLTSFAGESVDASTMLVATTLKGDTNLNYVVNFDDLLALAQNYGLTSRVWSQGDADYNGSVNFDDLLALAQNYGATYLADGNVVQDQEMAVRFSQDWALARSIVPEPASLGLLAGGLLAMKRRRA